MIVSAADGAGLHVLDQRPADPTAPTVLWLQGLNAPGAAWAVQIAHFSRTHRSIAPDTRGVGKSDAPKGPYTTAQLADDAVRILDACHVERAHVVGLSLGGAVAQELAVAHPGRVRTLALLASFAHQPPRSRALLEAWRVLYPVAAHGAQPDAAADRVRPSQAELAPPSQAEAAPALREGWEKQAYAWLFSDAFWRSEANMRAAFRFASSQPLQPVDGFVGQVDAAIAHDARSRLANLSVPALVVHGALDQLAPLAAGEELARLIPGAELRVIPGAGHAVNLEGQRAVNEALRALWKRG